MFWGKDRHEDEKLDRVGRTLIRAAAMSEKESDDATASPFLYKRVRAGIEAERLRREEAYDGWLQILHVARRAIPIMAMVAIVSFGFFWFEGARESRQTPTKDSLPGFPTPAASIMASASVCSIPAREGCAISTDEVLATIISRNGQEGKR
jgi:hypothetical protein